MELKGALQQYSSGSDLLSHHYKQPQVDDDSASSQSSDSAMDSQEASLGAAEAYQNLPPALQEILEKMLNSKPEMRPNARDLLSEPVFASQRHRLMAQYPPLPTLEKGKRKKLNDRRGAFLCELVSQWELQV